MKKAKKVFLINTNDVRIPYPVAPIGICLVSASLEDEYDVKIYDNNIQENNFLDELLEFQPDYVGLSIRNVDNLHIYSAKYFIDDIYNKFMPGLKEAINVPIILGGSGFSVFPEEIMKKFKADYGIVGEGEKTFKILLNYLDNNLDPGNIPGLIQGNSLKINKRQYPQGELEIPFSNIDKYINYDFYSRNSVYSIQTKRGCYHKCIYCSYPKIEGNIYRLRSPKNIVNEIEQAADRLGKITVEFVDSTFNDPPGHAEAICEEIIKRKIKINLRTMGINPENVNENIIELMIKAGFKEIDCTPDSASPVMIKNLKKNFSLPQLINTAKILQKMALPTIWFFILGGPGENEETILETYEFVDKYIYDYDMAHVTTGLRIYPDTDLYKIAISEGIIKPSDDILKPVFYISKKLSLEKLESLINSYAKKKPNFIPAEGTTPPQEMMNAAIKLRKKFNLQEPMFRTLLKIRYKYMKMQI